MALVSTWTPAYPSGHAVRASAGHVLVVWACHQYLRRRPVMRLTGMALAVATVLAVG